MSFWKFPAGIAVPFVTLSDLTRNNKVIEFRGRQVHIEYIPVLDQNRVNEKLVFCGCHAIKNGIVALGIAQGKFQKEAFTDRVVYQNIKDSIELGRDGDVSIAPLSEFLEKMSAPSVQGQPQSSETLALVREVVKNSASPLSLLNYEGGVANVIELGILGGDETSLPYIAGLVEVQKKLNGTDPFHHVFVMGSKGHWVTLVLEKNAEGSIRLYGLDSWKNETTRFSGHIQMLEGLLANPQFFAQKTYANSIGEDLERKLKLFHQEGASAGQLKNPSDATRLMQEENKNKYLNRIAYAADFFRCVGWTQDSHPEAFLAVRMLANFYNTTERQDPRVINALRIVGN